MKTDIDLESLNGMTKSGLQQRLSAALAELNEMEDSYTKGELTPEEVADLERLADFGEAIKAKIAEFPSVPDIKDRASNLKTFARRPATSPPPSAGKTTNGDGSATKTREPGGPGGGSPFSVHGATVKSLGDVIVDQLKAEVAIGRGWQQRRSGQNWGTELKCFDRLTDLVAEDEDGEYQPYKAAFTTGGAGLTAYERRPGVVDVRQQRLYVADLFQSGTLDLPRYVYVRETSFTNNAATVAEGAAKPEAALATEEVEVTAKKIAVYKKFSEELLMDYSGLRSWIDGRLRFMVMQEEEDQLLNGDGTGTNFEGLLSVSGVQTETAADATDNIEAVHRGITKVRAVGFSEPDGIVIHPTDYQTLRLTRDANDQFVGGGPFTGPYGNGMVASGILPLWGLRTVVTTAIAQGTVLVGEFNQGQFFRLNGVMVQMTNSDQDDFIKNLVTIRAEERGLLAIYRPSAFTAVTLA